MRRPLDDLGFVTSSVMTEGRFRPTATFTCKCGDTLTLTEAPGRKLNPEFVAKRARAAGWEADGWRTSVTRCPTCQVKSRSGESPGEKVIRMPLPEQPKLPATIPTVAADEQPREPTSKQRLAIRTKLDACFDDEAGCYLDGQSDQKIGEELKLPWSWVAKVREAAYGPIRVDAEVVALRGEITSLRADQKKLAEELKKLDGRIADLTGKLDGIEKKRRAA